MELIGIVFKNWDLYNSRKDVTKSSWFRFEHSFFDSSQFYGWSPLDRTIFVYLLCEASKQTKPGQNLVRVNPSHATACTSGILKDLHRVIKKLKQLQIVEIRTLRGRYADVTPTCSTNETNETNERTKEENPKPLSAHADPQNHQLVDIWNQVSGTLPKVKILSAQRERKAKLAWGNNPSPEFWTEIVTKLRSSPFCTGTNDRGWVADFDFLLKPETPARVLEGKYDARIPNSRPPISAEAEQADREAEEIQKAYQAKMMKIREEMETEESEYE